MIKGLESKTKQRQKPSAAKLWATWCFQPHMEVTSAISFSTICDIFLGGGSPKKRNDVQSFTAHMNPHLFLSLELAMFDAWIKKRNNGYSNSSGYNCLHSCIRKLCFVHSSDDGHLDLLHEAGLPRKQSSSCQCHQEFYLQVGAGINTGCFPIFV